MRETKEHPPTARLAAVLVVLLAALSLPTLAAPRDPAVVEAELAAYLDGLFESEPAWGNALVAREGRVLFEKGYGWSDYDQARPNDRKTPFRIQSMSKTFAAMATLILVERGRVALDDPVLDYVPELVHGEGVAVRHLLRMESGIPDYSDNPEVWANIDRFHTPEEVLDYFVDLPLVFEPGDRFDYSNSNYVLLGLIIERVSGRSYGKFLKKNIFKPLKMRRSRYDPTDRSFPITRAVGYDDVAVEPPIEATYIHPSLAYAAGGILATARNLLRWDQALYTDRILTQETLEEAFTPGPAGYAFGWIIDRVRIEGKRHRVVWHTGGGPGFRSILLRLTDANVTLVVLFNTTGVEDLDDEDVFRLIPKIAKRIGRIVLAEEE